MKFTSHHSAIYLRRRRTMPACLDVNPSDIDFTKPVTVVNEAYSCHYQYASIKGEPIYIQTPKFYSKGSIKSRFNDKLQLILPSHCALTLLKVDAKAKNMFQLPKDAVNQSWKRFAKDDIYKSIDGDKLYLKFSNDYSCYDTDGNVMNDCELSAGDYTLILHVIGIYIGSHGSSSHMASLMVRIKQVQFSAKVQSECLFIRPSLLERRGKTLPQLNLKDIGPAVGDLDPSNIATPKRRTVKAPKRKLVFSTSDDEEEKVDKVIKSTDSDSEEGEEEDLRIRSEKANSLLNAYRMNDYSTQQVNREEQIIHDSFLASLDSQLCDILGNDWKDKHL